MNDNSEQLLRNMFDAVEQNDLPALTRLLDEGADPTDISYEDGYTPLGFAVEEGRIDLVKIMLERGANPNLGGMVTTTLEAAENGRLDILRMLLAAGADPDQVDEDGESARTWARRNAAGDILKMIENEKSN